MRTLSHTRRVRCAKELFGPFLNWSAVRAIDVSFHFDITPVRKTPGIALLRSLIRFALPCGVSRKLSPQEYFLREKSPGRGCDVSHRNTLSDADFVFGKY